MDNVMLDSPDLPKKEQQNAPDENGEKQGEIPQEQDKTGELRDGKGRFIQGVSGNPNGRPKDLSITRMVREALEKAEEKTGESWKSLIVKRILYKAVSEGDTVMLKTIWNYIDGMPKITGEFTQRTETDQGVEILRGIIVEERKKIHDATALPDVSNERETDSTDTGTE